MQKEMKRLSKKSQLLFILTVFNTLLSVVLYYFLGSLIEGISGKGIAVQWVYFALALGFGLVATGMILDRITRLRLEMARLLYLATPPPGPQGGGPPL